MRSSLRSSDQRGWPKTSFFIGNRLVELTVISIHFSKCCKTSVWLVCCSLQLWTLPFTLQRCYVSEACATWALWDLLLTTGKDLETRPAGAADWSTARAGGGLWVLRQVTWAQMERAALWSAVLVGLALGKCFCHIMWNEIDFRSRELYMRWCTCKRKQEKETLWWLSLNLIG